MLGDSVMSNNLEQLAETAVLHLQARRYNEAEQTLNTILSQDPRHRDGLQLMGVLHQRTGRLQEAEKFLLAAIDINPEFWPAHLNIAGLLIKTGRPQEAMKYAKKATQLAPDEPLGWRHLADAAEQTADFETGSAAFEKLSALGQTDAQTEIRSALHGILSGRLPAARLALDRAQKAGAPKDRLYPVAAELSIKEGKWQELKSIAAAWKNLAPNARKPVSLSARAELELGNMEAAADIYRSLIENNIEITAEDALIYGRICLNSQQFDEAASYLSRAAEADPDNPDAIVSLARLKTFEGEIEEAEKLCKQALSKAPDHIRAYHQLCVTTRGKIDSHYRERMIAILEQGVSDPALKAGLAFSLGDVFFRSGEAKTSLQYYEQGNTRRLEEGRARGFPYIGEVMEKDVGLLREASEFLLEAFDRPQTEDRTTPIFITGMPRSGTTLMERIIGAHSEVTPLGERQAGPGLLEQFVMQLRQMDVRAAVQWFENKSDSFREKYLQGTDEVETAFFTDKMPGNALAIPLLSALFPKAKFILTRRCPFDIAVSIYRHQFPFAYSWAHRFEDIAHYMPIMMGAAADFVRALPGRAHIVDYDSLAKQPAEDSRELMSCLELEWEEGCLRPACKGQRVATFSSVQVRDSISPKSSDGGSLFRPLMKSYASELDQNVFQAMS